MEVNEEMEHISYGEETGNFHEALKGNAANFERKLERVRLFSSLRPASTLQKWSCIHNNVEENNLIVAL